MKMMKCLALTIVASLVAVPAASSETLGDMLRNSGFDKILGTWVDEETGGDRIHTTYKWRFKDRVLDVSTRTPDTDSAGMIAVSGESGEVVHVGADNKGGTAIGKWSEEDEDAVLELAYVTEGGDGGTMRIRHHFEDADTMTVTIEVGGEEISISMVRKK